MPATRRFIVRQGEEATPVEVLPDGRVRVGEPGEIFVVTAISPGHYIVAGGGATWPVAAAGPPEARWVGSQGASACLDVQPASQSRAARRQTVHGGLAAPMPGTVLAIGVAVGQRVGAGDVLVTLEAMKMELPVRAPRDGVVSAIHCAPGDLVQPGPLLVELT